MINPYAIYALGVLTGIYVGFIIMGMIRFIRWKR